MARRVQTHGRRFLTGGDSRVALGAGAKGRSPSANVDNDLKSVVPDYLGADLASASFWMESARCPADEPSRKRRVLRPAAPTSREEKILRGELPLVPEETELAWRTGLWTPSPPPPLRRRSPWDLWRG